MNQGTGLTKEASKRKSVGILGLGIMGSAISEHLLGAGFRVVGYDPSFDAVSNLEARGGEKAADPKSVADQCSTILSLLPNSSALKDVIGGEGGILSSERSGIVLAEASTLPLVDKLAARDLAGPSLTVLDCPLSGTGAQAVVKDLIVYASGDRDAFEMCTPVFSAFSRSAPYVGPFGDGSKMKFVANLLVAIHNVAAAEAMVLGMKAGLEPERIYDIIESGGAAGSKMFSFRGPLMVNGLYEPATMKIDTWLKDLGIIEAFACEFEVRTPLFSQCKPLYERAHSEGLGAQDTAAVCTVLEEMASLGRRVQR